MIRLLATVSWVVRWITRSPRRAVGLLVLPVLLVVALAAGPIRGRTADGETLARGTSPAPPTADRGTPRPSGLPGTTGPASPVPSRPAPTLAPEQRQVALDYVSVANSHDARPGHDRAFLDSYRRARPYVTPRLYTVLTADGRRGDYEWTVWLRQRARVDVEIVAAGVPDGAPAPTATAAYARVEFRQVVKPTVGAGAEQASDGAINLLVTRDGSGRWLVSRLLADT